MQLLRNIIVFLEYLLTLNVLFENKNVKYMSIYNHNVLFCIMKATLYISKKKSLNFDFYYVYRKYDWSEKNILFCIPRGVFLRKITKKHIIEWQNSIIKIAYRLG